MQIKTKTSTFFLFLFSFFIILPSCKRSTAPQNDQPPVHQPEPLFNLTLQDSTCTEVWLKLSIDSAYLHKDFILKRDAKIIHQFSLKQNDTLLYDENLHPAQTYKYQAFVQDSLKILDSSNVLTTTTMDTTSHDFTWQTFEFGGQGGSSFYDVAIIEENDPSGGDSQTGIWAVGEIYTADDKYNAAHWDGEKWELKKILFHTFCDHGTLIPYPARAVFFIDNTLLISSGSEITFIKNGTQIKNQCTPVSINKIWGTSSTDLYVVGDNGLIAHYDGRNWQRIESETDIKLLDIWGSKDGKTVWACGWEDFKPTVLYKINNLSMVKIYENQTYLFQYRPNAISGGIFGIWTYNSRHVYVLTWFDLYRCTPDNIPNGKALWQGKDMNIWAHYSVRGTGSNHIVTVGTNASIWHYNGVSWKWYDQIANSNDDLYQVSVTEDLIVAVGERYLNAINSYGIIYIGFRR